MIVKNGEATLARCIGSIHRYVDEINVYDTGSTDGTLALLDLLAAESDPGAAPIRVRRGEWRNDFAWAREQSFAMASHDMGWIVLVDADEEVVGAGELRALVREATPDVDGFVIYWDIERDDAGNTTLQAWRERLVRRSAGFRWRGAAHTVLVPPPDRPANLVAVPRERLKFVHHRERDRWHPGRALDILEGEIESSGPEDVDARTLFYLAGEQMWRGDFEAAADSLQRFLERAETSAPELRAVAVHRLATCLRAARRVEEAIRLELDSQRELPHWPETALGLAASYAALERWNESERWARRTLDLGEPASVFLHRPLELRVVPHLRLAEAHLEQGRPAQAVASFGRARDAAAGSAFVEERSRRFEDAVATGDFELARRRLNEAIAHYDETFHGFVRQLALAAQEQHPTAGPLTT